MLEKKLNWIQMLRGVAALLVVFTHARYAMLNTPDWPLANQLLLPGAMGVDLFFIISGFIMCYSTAGARGDWRSVLSFLVRRFARVWPAYAVVTLVFVVMFYSRHYFDDAYNVHTLLRSLAMLPVDPKAAPYFAVSFPLGWTLEFEMYFYLVFAASMLFKRLRWFTLVSWVLLSVIVIPLGRRGFDLDVTAYLQYHSAYMAIVTSPFVLEFLAGVAIAWLYRAGWFRLRSEVVAWHILGLGVGFALWSAYSNVVFMHGPMHWGWPLALMVLSMALASKTVDIATPPLLLWLGSISYSLYLTHMLTQHAVTSVLEKLALAPYAHTWGFVFLSSCLALPVAALSQRYLEGSLALWVRNGLLKLISPRAEALADPAVGATRWARTWPLQKKPERSEPSSTGALRQRM